MTAEGKWRFIRVGPNGEFIGAHTPRPGKQPGEEDGGDDEGDGEGEGDSGEPPADEPPEEDNESLPLAGVASRSSARSIRIYQGQERYDYWEFIYDPTQEVGAGQGQPQQKRPADGPQRKPTS
jgi:hypothetical protein